jgi:ketosteroid isomerase-like protein
MESMNRLLIFLTIVIILLWEPCPTCPRRVALRSAYAAFHRGDVDAAVEPFDAQIEWTEPAEFPGGGTYHGREAVKRYLAQSCSSWTEGSSGLERFITSGNRIVVLVHVRAHSKVSNEWNEEQVADLYTIRNGQPVEMRAFADRRSTPLGRSERSKSLRQSIPCDAVNQRS